MSSTSVDLKQKVVKGTLWTLLEKFTTQLAGFCVTLVLARLLTPDDYGTVALLTLIINISTVLLDSGFGQALVQKKNADALDFNSVFYLSLGVSIAIYVTLFAAAPLVARFYTRPELVWLLRVLATTLVFGAINSVQGAELSRKMLFNLSFRISLTRFLLTSITGIALALMKFGPWALVLSTVAGSIGTVCASWAFIGWRPQFIFSWQALRGLFSFGWKFSASWFLSMTYENVYGMVIGRVYSPADLAFLEKGRQLPRLGMSSINGAIGRVSFPAIAQIQDDLLRVRAVMRRMITCSTFLVFPMMVGMSICSKDIVAIFYGEQWNASVPFTAIACFSFMLFPFHTINLQTLSALGRSDIFLKLEIIKTAVAALALACTYRFGVVWMVATGAFVVGPLGVFINAYPNQRLLGYTVKMQICDTLPTALACVLMAIVIWPIGQVPMVPFLRVFVQIVLGMLSFAIFSYLLRVSAMREYLAVLDSVPSNRMPKFLACTLVAVEKRFDS